MIVRKWDQQEEKLVKLSEDEVAISFDIMPITSLTIHMHATLNRYILLSIAKPMGWDTGFELE